MSRIYAEHGFFPVGQGLFATGTVGVDERQRPSFRWVYDCGTLSSRKLVERSLSELEAEVTHHTRGKPALDLVVISHFDADHLNGLADLLTRFRVDTLVLPFTHLGQRLRAMFNARPYTAIAQQAFFLDPIGTISSIEGVDIGQIVLVPPSGAEPAPNPGVNPDAPQPPPSRSDEGSNRKPKLEFDEGEPRTPAEQEELASALVGASKQGIPLRWMRADSAATYAGLWEFVPFNEPSAARAVDAAFQRDVANHRRQLLAASSLDNRKNAVAALRTVYDAKFGKHGRERNIISLFLYSGPIGMRSQESFAGRLASRPGRRLCMGVCTICWHDWLSDQELDSARDRTGVLYTGDGFVENEGRWRTLNRFYGAARMDGIAALQVMHHGSRKNWYVGLADAIRPSVSVFSSDPKRGTKKKKPTISGKKTRTHAPHPHAVVVDDFRRYGPIQADTEFGVRILTRY